MSRRGGERAEYEALRDADFTGLPREALIATIHDLAERLLVDDVAEVEPCGSWRVLAESEGNSVAHSLV